MSSLLPNFVLKLEQARKDLNKVTSPQLHSQKQRNYLRTLVEDYFNAIRPCFMGASEQYQDVVDVDDLMQKLLVLCHKRGSVNRYKTLLSKARKGLIALDSRLVALPLPRSDENPHPDNSVDLMIIDTLNLIVPSAALSYQQALQDIQTDKRLSWRGPATDLREALRETLDHLAPDSDVTGMPGYKQSPDINGPTMKQKVRFIMKSRSITRALSAPAETAIELVESAVGSFVRSVNTRANVSIHTPTDKAEVIRIRDFVRVVFCELLEVHT